jgi:hypothetical protein
VFIASSSSGGDAKRSKIQSRRTRKRSMQYSTLFLKPRVPLTRILQSLTKRCMHPFCSCFLAHAFKLRLWVWDSVFCLGSRRTHLSGSRFAAAESNARMLDWAKKSQRLCLSRPGELITAGTQSQLLSKAEGRSFMCVGVGYIFTSPIKSFRVNSEGGISQNRKKNQRPLLNMKPCY